MSPASRDLYEYARERMPDAYKALRDLDTLLAEHIAALQDLVRQRQYILHEMIPKHIRLTSDMRTSTIISDYIR